MINFLKAWAVSLLVDGAHYGMLRPKICLILWCSRLSAERLHLSTTPLIVKTSGGTGND